MKYKGVVYFKKIGKWKMQFLNKTTGLRSNGFYDTERQAAISYDIKCIENGMKPVNILKRNEIQGNN